MSKTYNDLLASKRKGEMVIEEESPQVSITSETNEYMKKRKEVAQKNMQLQMNNFTRSQTSCDRKIKTANDAQRSRNHMNNSPPSDNYQTMEVNDRLHWVNTSSKKSITDEFLNADLASI